MEMQDKPLRKLYTSLKSNNYDVPDNYESFERTLTESGQSGAQSRRALHESLKKNNYDVPDSYDSFYKSLFTPVNSTTSMAIGSEPVKPAPQKPTTGTSQHTVQPTKPAPAQPVKPQQVQKPQGKPMTAAQKAAAIGWAQGLTALTKASTQQAIQKVKNISNYQKAKGVYGQTKKGNVEYNPQTGKMEQTYLTPQGEQTTHKATADMASHQFRVQQGFLNRMTDNDLNPDNPEDVAKQHQLDKEKPIRDVLDTVWGEAEALDKRAQEEMRSKTSTFNLSSLAEASSGAGGALAGHDRNFNDELAYQQKRHNAFDFDKMAKTMYARLPEDYRANMLKEYTSYFSKHPNETKGKSAVEAAKAALQGQMYNAVYQRAVKANTPKSGLEFLLRKIADQPLISSSMAANTAAAALTGSHGLNIAERDAMAQFGSQHKAMNIMGTVANMALDPITYVSGGVGGFVGKKALGVAGKAMLNKATEKATEKAVGKVATDVASRYAAGTLAGRVAQGVAGGAANFATFNTLKGIEEQVQVGGVVNPETGKSEGFSVGEILKSTGHGLLLGAATGTLSPIIGNFADKAVKATTSTVGKVALRAGETAVSTVAEGTVFSIPEWISGQGDAFDVWTDNMGMMLGFKASHAIKSAPRVLDALRTDGKRYGFSFKERLNKQMEASPSDAGFTSEELDELRNNGYMDLSMLFRNAQKQKSTNPKSHEVSKEVIDDYENLTPDTFDGYEAMKRLMNDRGVSEATRAKAYYILTGRMLPMSTITGYTTDKTEDGDIIVKSMSAQGDVVTSRQFTNEKAAQGEIDKIMRQSELNSVDVGEKYKETASNMLVVETAIKEVAPDADMETVLQNYRKVKSGQEDMPQEIIDQAKAIDVAIERNRDIANANRPEAIRAKLNKETGLDVDATLRKMPKDRTEEEKELVDTYIKSLFPEQEKTEDGQTAEAQADAEYQQRIEVRQQSYDEGREAFNVADAEGDSSDADAIVLRLREAYDEIERVFADDAEMRLAQLEDDPWEVMDDRSLTADQQDAVAYFVNSKAAMDGLTEAANENSENKRAEAEHKIAQRTNKQSGMIHPATLKVDDKQVYIVSGNVTMFPDGSTVDIHHSSESVVVCDAETGELKFISPEQIYKVDELMDPDIELQAADEAIRAEQQVVLGNDTEEAPEQTEEVANDGVASDVQNENEVNLPQGGNIQQNSIESDVNLPQNETDVQEPSALNRIPKGDNGEPLLEQTDPETAWDGVVEYMEDADDAQEYVESMVAQLTKDVDNAKKAVSKVKPSADMAKFKADKAAARQIQADAEARLDKWVQISNVNKARKQAELNRVNIEHAEAERVAREKAVAELAEQKRIEAEKKAEQEAIGAHAVNPKIKEKWDAAPKAVGNADIITLPDGSKLRGHYVLTEAGAATASHDVNNAYKPTEGFPIDENGQSVNDRDYERDEDARKISRSIADNYDSRALQSVTVVDNNGITLSGNGRNIAGELAAQQGTDGAYIDYLREFPQKYGLTAEQVQSMQHPRVHFVPDEVLPYDAATFARFNAQEMKSQSKPEAAVKLGKVVPDNTFGNIVRSLAQYDRLSDFYANEKDANGAIMELVKAGVVNDKQLPELRTGDALSAAGRELLENTLIGKVFQSNPDAVRQIIAQPGIKQSIVMALSEIAHNRTLANGYDLSEELSNAVDLVARAKQADPDTYKEGMPVSPFGRQQGLFDDELGDKRVTDATTLLLADILNSTKPSDLRKVLATYNGEGETAANGQLDIFSGDLRSKEEILSDINKHFINATSKEQQALVDAAIAERKRRAAEAAATEQSGGNDTAEQAATNETNSGQPQPVPVESTPIGETSTPAEVQAQREQTETNPTEAQKEAGNYRKGHIKVDGYDIALENPKGSTRSGKDANAKEWSITMKHDYGYIRGTKGTDGDHIDVYLSDNPTAGNVYVVDQVNQRTGDFDEHKVMYGFNSMEEAVQAYRDQYEDGWKVGAVTEVSREEFKKWVDSSARKTKPFADYKTVKPLETEHTQSGENYAHNSEEIMHEDVKPAESSEKYTITPTQYTNKKGKTSDMYLVKFNHELSKEEKAAAKTFISEPLAEGKRTPRGWYDREQGGYMVRSEEAAKQLGDMMADEIAVADEQPVTAKDYRNTVAPTTHDEQEKKPANTVTVEDAAIQDVEAKVYKPESEKKGLQFNGDVSKEDFNDALKDLRSLLGVSDDEGDVGILFRDGEELTKEQRKKIKAAGLSVTQVLVDNGMVKFSDYAGKMVSLIGDKIRPWLKSFYEGIRWEPGYESVEFTPSDEVARFDVQNFDKPTPDVLKQAEMVVAEQKAAKISKQTEQEVRTERNEKRKEDEKQAEANTTAITEEAGAVASKARTVAKRATTDTEVRKATEEVEAALEKVNNQLALLGYYEAEKVAKDFNEAYGYMRNAEKKAVKDATTLAKRIADDLGVDIYEATHTAPGKNGKRKSKPLAVANIAPIGGDITIHLPMGEGKNLSIYVNLKSTDSKGSFIQGDNLEVGRIMYRLENPAASGQEQYGVNNFADPDITYNELIEGINRVINSTNKVILSKENVVSSDLPEFNIGDKVMYKGKEATLYDIDRSDNNRPILDTGLAPVMYEVTNWEELSPVTKSEEAIPTKEEKVSTEKEKPAKKNNSKKKDVSLKREPTVGDLFGDLFDNNDLDSKDNDTARTRQAESSSRENGTVGSISTERDGVLDTRSTGTADGGEAARVSDTAGTVADGERKELLGQRSSRSTSGGNHRDGEAERPMPERGQRIGDRDDANGRSTIARATDESQRTSRPAVGNSEQLVHGEARRGGRGRNVASAKQPEPKFKRNYLYPEDSSEVDNMTPQQRLRSNVEALEVVRTLMKEGREATADERDVLGRYRGWGGVDLGRAYSTDMMRRSSNGRWGTQTENDKLLSRLADIIDELDPDGKRGVLSAINRAALTSYYTPTAVAKTLNDFVELAGFKGGNMLDPSMGSGIFEGTMSKAVQQRTMIHGVELDWLTGQIARNLYPDANVLVTGYEQAGTADNAYDVVMSNIPFGDLSVTDKTWKHDSSPVRKAAQNRIHNYFAVKMLDNTRPGGLCVIMTSNAILDTKSNQIIREHLADKAEVLGVVRLPDNTFKGAGTSVVTDVILLRKYKNEADRIATRGNETYTTNIEKPFLSSGELQLKNPTDGKTYNVTVNGYFTKNKDMMIGDGKAGGQYRADEFGLSSTMSTDEIAKSIRNLVEKKIIADRKGKLFDTHKTEREVKQAVSEAYKGDGNYISSGNIVEQDGMMGVVTSTKNKYGDVTTTFNEIPSLKGKAERIEAMLPIRKAMKQLIDMQIQGVDNNHLEEARTELQNTYDAFVKKYGRLNDKANDFLTEDIDGYTLRSLEKYKDSKFIGLSDIFTKNTIKPALDMTTAKTPQDAISLSLAEYGEIKPSFMKDVLGENWVEQCGDTLFKTPFTEDEYETVDAYLSGDVKTKLEQARTAAKEDATLQRNVDALEAVQPKDIPFEDISIRMGARWIPAEVYTDFMYEQFGIPKYIHRGNKSGVEYLPEVDQYVVNVDKKELGGEADAWRTSRRSASEVFTAALQDKSLSVFDTIKEGGKETKVLNKEETELLNNKIQDLRTAFEDWIGQNPEREEMLMRLYNDKFNRTVLRKFDGSHLNVAGLMGKELRPHQKDAVWMLINNRGGIVDHIVGAGKTLVMQSAIMEMRRMGIAKKPMIIALKSTVAQIAKEFREAYPAARILAPTEKDFAANNRKKFMAQIALNDYDCVILSHDQYNMLPHTEEVERSVIDEQMAQLDNAIEFLYGQDDKSQLTKKQIKGLEKRKNNLETKLTNLLDRKIDREFTFEGLGVDYLFVDECQHFKSLPYVSTYDRVAGLGDKKGSQKSIALLNGVRYLQKMHQGDQGTVFLSGTTISNSLSEIYHLLNYLRPSEMERLGMTTFDAWAGNFAIHTAELEYGVTSELKEKDRFRSLTNIPELAKMYAEIADVRNDMNLKLPKPKMRSHIVTVPQTDLMQEINREIVNMVKNKDGDYFNIDSNENTPWGLLASTYSAKAAINPRLIDESWESEGGKIPAVCENVKKIYDQFAEQKGTQLIFCDTGVPGKGKKYDAYSDIINRLVNDYGIPRKEIADIHEANTDEKRKELFAKVNDGSVRILIGGTKNMGTGVNVQKRIVAMHHVDVPWTPADREQREGRGVRQGNEIARDFNDDNVDVYFYATEGSLDMYKYQLQETKGKLFAQFKSGTIGDRTFDEGDAEGDFDPAEVVAMLSGNPVIFEKSKQDKKVEKLRRAKRAYESDWQRRHARYEELQTKKRNYERLLSLNASDVRELERGGFTADAEGKYPSTVTVSVKDDYSSRKTFEKPKEAGAYIHELLKRNKRVQLSGFQQTANISIPITDAGLFGKPVAELESYGGIKYAVEVSDDDTAAGVAFRNLLQKVYSNKKVYERNIEDVNNQLKGADPGENVYPKQAELDEALKEKRRLDEEYKKLSDEEDKPAASDDTRYRDFDEEVNEQFNRELVGLTEENADTKIFNLGSPSSILLSAGVEDKPMKLYGNKVIKKMKKHGFALEELQDLPKAVANPIAVFNNYQREGNRTILTELRSQEKNIMVAVTLGKNGVDVDFNIVSSVFGKGSTNIVDWISKGYLAYVDKEKALNYLYFSERNISEAADNPKLSSTAKIVKDFVNPNIGEEKTSLQGKIAPQDTTPQAKALQAKVLSEKLNTPIRVVSDPEEIAKLPSRRQQRAKGWWSAKNDEVVILLPNNADVADVANTAVHEVVGHNGLRKLIGVERFDDFLGEVYEHASKPIRAAIDKAERKLFDAEVDRLTQQKNVEADRPESRKGVFSRAEATVEANKKREQMRREATEEYMADMAGRIGDEGFEKMSAEELTFWGKVKAKVQQFLDKFLRGLKIAKGVRLTDKDVAYILYRSWKNLRNGGKPTIMDAAEDALMRNKTNYNEADISRFRDGDMGLDETITSMKAEISAANKDDFNAKVEAMKAIGGNLQKLRSAMSRQRSYDISTAKAMTDLAQVLLDKGLLDNLSVYETKRVLSAVRNGVGKEDISGHVQKLMDIMVDNQLHSGANMLGKLFTIRGTRLNDRGIEVQGNLDPQGQILVKTARKYTSFPKEEIDNTLIPDLMSRMGSDDQTIADNAAIEYAGAQIARRYVEEITESKAEEKALRESIKTAKEDKDAGKLDAEAYKQYVNATEEAIRQNKIDRAEAYSSIAAEFGGMLGESAKRAKEWREAEQKRINDIHHNCNSDMEGRITDEHHKDNKVQKLMNNSAIRFLLAPLGTFDQMLRMFGKKNVNGEGYLWNRFMRSWVDATENEYTGYRDDLKELDAKVSEVYGKKMKWADLFTLERKMGKISVEFWDGGERKLHELTQGNLLYIYMVDKMSDGRMKLRYMGITEQDVQHITEILDPKFKELADWLQEEYLVNKRNKYNEVHKRMFGAPMAAIDNYFPLKILKNALDKEEDVAEDDNAGIVLPGTTTNGIIKRTRNNKPLDVTGADAFNVIADHLQEMEHWAAFAELTRDINTLLSYKRFRNQVMNMSSAYGAGAVLWKNFRSVCKMAVGAYRPPIAELDKTAVNVAKGVTAAKVSFRVFTALKQFLSFPAYLPDASLAHLAKDVVNPVSAWKWSMENLPIFEKRWQSRMAGDPRLMKSDMDWKAWRSRIVEIASMIGMSPNAFVDALTVAMGAHAMYQSRYAKYKRWGFDEATADKRAKQDATILYNSTQQSSEGAFLSPMQVDRSWLSVLFTVFRNSSISYKRQEYDAWRNEVKLFTPGYRQRAEEFMIKQLQREGLTEEQAKKAAHEELRKGPLHNLARIFVFGFLLQYTWNLGAYLPYLILGDDDDEKSKMTNDALTHALFGSLEGLTSGDVLSQAGNMALQGEGNWSTVTKDMPLVSDLSDILKTFPKDNVEALNDCINLLTQSAVGVNPQSITDAMVAIIDYCGDDAQTSRECALLMARILNCPQSQLDKIYFDELSASGVEASKMTPSQIAERFARYKRHRSAPLTGWMYSDAAIADKDGKRKETVYKKARENFKAAASKSNKEELEQWKAEYKETAAKLSAIKKLREQDEDEADEQMDALENTPEYDRYLIMKDYNSDMNDITKAWLSSKSPTEREQLTKAMFKVQQEMVNELKTSK